MMTETEFYWRLNAAERKRTDKAIRILLRASFSFQDAFSLAVSNLQAKSIQRKQAYEDKLYGFASK